MMLVCRQVLIPQIITDSGPLQSSDIDTDTNNGNSTCQIQQNLYLRPFIQLIYPGQNGKSYDPLGTQLRQNS